MLLESVVGMRGGHVGHVDVDIALLFSITIFASPSLGLLVRSNIGYQ